MIDEEGARRAKAAQERLATAKQAIASAEQSERIRDCAIELIAAEAHYRATLDSLAP
jgi:hypothetical protein